MTRWRFVLRNAERGEYELQHEPANWRQRQTRLTRNMRWYGVSLEITSPIEFVLDGYAYVRDVFNKEGYNGVVWLDVFELNPSTRRYESYFSGRLILKSIDMSDTTLQVLATPVTLEELIKTRGNKKVRLSDLFSLDQSVVFPITPVTVLTHSRRILKTAKARWAQRRVISMNSGQVLQLGFDELVVDELQEWITERVTIASTEAFPVYKAKESGAHTLDVYLVMETSSAFEDEIAFFYQINEETPVAVSTSFDLFTDPPFSYSVIIAEITDTFTLTAGDTLRFYGVCGRNFTITTGITGFDRPSTVPDDKFILTALTEVPATPVQGYLAHEALDQVLKMISGERSVLQSNYLGRTDIGYGQDGPGSLNLITTGAALNGRTLDLNISLDELLGGLQSCYNIGLGVTRDSFGQQKAVVEPMSFFFTNRIGWQINGISQLRKRVATDLVFNSVVTGFKKYDTDEPGGVNDPHTEGTYHIPALFIDSAKDIRSDLIGSAVSIESKRRSKVSENKKEAGDDDPYLLNLIRSVGDYPYETAKDEAFDTVTGVEDPGSMYNLDIHPARNLQRWGAYFAPNFYRKSALLGFQTSPSASRMETQKTGEPRIIRENTSLTSTELLRPLWLPEVYEFECELDVVADRAILANRYDIGQVSTGEGVYYGYLLERSRTEQNKANFILLRANYNG